MFTQKWEAAEPNSRDQKEGRRVLDSCQSAVRSAGMRVFTRPPEKHTHSIADGDLIIMYAGGPGRRGGAPPGFAFFFGVVEQRKK